MYKKLEEAMREIALVDWDNYSGPRDRATQLILEYIEEGYKLKETNPLGD